MIEKTQDTQNTASICAWCSPKQFASANQGERGFRICEKHSSNLKETAMKKRKAS